MNAFQQCLDMQPSSPQGLPPWRAIAFAAQIAAIAGNVMPTLLDGHRLSIAVIQMCHHLYDVKWQYLACRLLGILLDAARSCIKRTARGKGTPISCAIPHSPGLTLLELAARFESLMKSSTIQRARYQSTRCSACSWVWVESYWQDPFQCFHSFGWFWLPDVDHPHHQRMPAFALLAPRRQQAQGLPRAKPSRCGPFLD